MQRVATELCKIQEYELFKSLMKEVRLFRCFSLQEKIKIILFDLFRKLEIDIAKYQDFLRKTIQHKELNIYNKIGEERLDDFYDKYDQAFKKVQNNLSDFFR